MMVRALLWFLCAALVSAGLARLGYWQWQRAQEKEAIIAGLDRARQAAPLDYEAAVRAASEQGYAAVLLRGRYDPTHQIYHDAQLREGKPGLQVYTPFETEAGAWLLVARGWTPLPVESRQQLPALPTPTETVELRGVLSPPPGAAMRMGATTTHTDWPWLTPRIDLDESAQRLQRPLLDFVLQLDPASPAALLRDWQPGFLPPERHRGYAVQWYALALTVLVIYFVLLWRQLKAGRRHPAATHST